MNEAKTAEGNPYAFASVATNPQYCQLPRWQVRETAQENQTLHALVALAPTTTRTNAKSHTFPYLEVGNTGYWVILPPCSCLLLKPFARLQPLATAWRILQGLTLAINALFGFAHFFILQALASPSISLEPFASLVLRKKRFFAPLRKASFLSCAPLGRFVLRVGNPRKTDYRKHR